MGPNSKRGQGSFEYILLIAGLALAATIVFTFLQSAATSSANQTNQTYAGFTRALQTSYTPFPQSGGGGALVGGGGPDSTMPTVNQISPSSASVGTSVVFSASANDSGGISNCYFYWNGISQGKMALSGSATNVTITFTKTPAASGSFPAYANCSDLAGNYAAGSPVSVTVSDLSAPQYSSFGPASMLLEQGNPTGLNGYSQWTDNVGVAKFKLSRCSPACTDVSGTWSNDSEMDLSSGWANYTPTYGAVGTYSWRIWARDAANNWNATPVGTITVVQETKPPLYFAPTIGTNATGPNPATGEFVKHSGQWSDNVALSGFIFASNYSGAWSNDTWQAFAISNNSWSNVSKALPSSVGTFGWKIYANDTSNNWNATPNQTITPVDKAAPQFSAVSQNTSTPSLGTYIRLSFTVSDNIALSGYNFSSNFSGTWQNDSWQPLSGATQAITLDKLAPSAGGAYGWRIYANDTSNNLNVSGQLNFTASDTTPPQYSGAQLNNSAPYTDDALGFSALWTDNGALANATLETNLTTGNLALQNFTVQLNGASDFSNFTITPIAANVFQWRIYANDTAHNYAATPKYTINVTQRPPVIYSFASPNQNVVVVKGSTVSYSAFWTETNSSRNLKEYRLWANKSGGWAPIVYTAVTGRSNWTNYSEVTSQEGAYGWYLEVMDNGTYYNRTPQLMVIVTAYYPRYSNAGMNVTSPVDAGATVDHYATWSDSTTLSGYIFSSNYSGAWQNDPWQAMPSSNLTDIVRNAPNTASVYGWRIWANDSAGNWNSTGGTFAIRDYIPPMWTSYSASSSTPLIMGQETFTSHWTDNVAVSGCLFSTNYTGTWANTSTYYGDVMGCSYTPVPRLPAFGPVYWRNYAYDTSNNWNATPIASVNYNATCNFEGGSYQPTDCGFTTDLPSFNCDVDPYGCGNGYDCPAVTSGSCGGNRCSGLSSCIGQYQANYVSGSRRHAGSNAYAINDTASSASTPYYYTTEKMAVMSPKIYGNASGKYVTFWVSSSDASGTAHDHYLFFWVYDNSSPSIKSSTTLGYCVQSGTGTCLSSDMISSTYRSNSATGADGTTWYRVTYPLPSGLASPFWVEWVPQIHKYSATYDAMSTFYTIDDFCISDSSGNCLNS